VISSAKNAPTVWKCREKTMRQACTGSEPRQSRRVKALWAPRY
jgi:hypothetical protein